MLVEHGNAIENPPKKWWFFMGKSICKWANLCKSWGKSSGSQDRLMFYRDPNRLKFELRHVLDPPIPSGYVKITNWKDPPIF